MPSRRCALLGCNRHVKHRTGTWLRRAWLHHRLSYATTIAAGAREPNKPWPTFGHCLAKKNLRNRIFNIRSPFFPTGSIMTGFPRYPTATTSSTSTSSVPRMAHASPKSRQNLRQTLTFSFIANALVHMIHLSSVFSSSVYYIQTNLAE